MELNPNHPVTQLVHDQWHKFVAVLMVKHQLSSVEITTADILHFNEMYPGGAVVCDTRDGRLVLRLVGQQEAARLVQTEGGLPA